MKSNYFTNYRKSKWAVIDSTWSALELKSWLERKRRHIICQVPVGNAISGIVLAISEIVFKFWFSNDYI